MERYAENHDGGRPEKASDLIQYLGDDGNCRVFICPTAVKQLTSKPPALVSEFKKKPEFFSYDFLSTTGLVEGPVWPPAAPVMCDKPDNHGKEGVSMLFADGHVAWWPGTLEEYAKKNDLSVTVVTNWVR